MSPSSPSSSTDPASSSPSSPSTSSLPSTSSSSLASTSSCSKSYYEILGVHPESNLSTIKDAYRSLILQYHPDKCCQQQANNNNTTNTNTNTNTRILSPLLEEEQVQDLDTPIDPSSSSSSSAAMIDGNEDKNHETNFPSHHDGTIDFPATCTSKPQIQSSESPPSTIPSKTQQEIKQQIKQQQSKQSKESTFVQIQQAWSCLRNKHSRNKYDESLFQTMEKQLQDYSNATPISLSEMDHEEITLVFDDDITDSNIIEEQQHEEYTYTYNANANANDNTNANEEEDHNDDENDSYDSEDIYEEDIMYSHDCRCGDRFELFASVLANPYLYPNIINHDRGGKKEEVVLMQCKSCSLSIRVHIDERIPDIFFNSKHFES